MVQTGRLERAQRLDLGAAAGRARGHAFALEIGHFLDSRAFGGHHVHNVGVGDAEGPEGKRILKVPLPLERIIGHIVHAEGQIGLLGADELAVIHGGGGHLRRGFDPCVLGEHTGNPAAQNEINPTHAACRHRYPFLVLGIEVWHPVQEGCPTHGGAELQKVPAYDPMTIVEQTIDSHHLILLFRLRGCGAITGQNRHARRWQRRPSGRGHSVGRAQALRAIPRGQRSDELRLIRAEGAERPWMPLRTQTA